MTRTIEMDGTGYEFTYEDTQWSVTFAESLTKVKAMDELELLKQPNEKMAPVEILHENDSYIFHYEIDKNTYSFAEIERMERKDKLRALHNVGSLAAFLSTRYTFFLHPDNIVFDLNLNPLIVHRGIKRILPPYEMNEETLFKQYRCLVIAMFSKKYSFENLYSGSLHNARATSFEKKVTETKSIRELMTLLEELYQAELKTVAKNMLLVPKKNFKTFKGLAIGFIIAAVLLAVPLLYFAFVKIPYQTTLLTANENFLKTDYDKVISDLEKVNPEKMPKTTQYELAYAYLQGEKLDDKRKENIMRSISLKSDPQTLLYWIYNGRGDFAKSNDIAKLLDQKDLRMYSLIKQLEQVKNNSKLSGNEKLSKQKAIEEELKTLDEETTKKDENK